MSLVCNIFTVVVFFVVVVFVVVVVVVKNWAKSSLPSKNMMP